MDKEIIHKARYLPTITKCELPLSVKGCLL